MPENTEFFKGFPIAAPLCRCRLLPELATAFSGRAGALITEFLGKSLRVRGRRSQPFCGLCTPCLAVKVSGKLFFLPREFLIEPDHCPVRRQVVPLDRGGVRNSAVSRRKPLTALFLGLHGQDGSPKLARVEIRLSTWAFNIEPRWRITLA